MTREPFRLVNPGRIVMLNGPPRSGKSSIAAAMQASLEGLWMNLGVDGFRRMTPERYQPGIGLRPGAGRVDVEEWVPALYAALFESIAAHSRLGINVVCDVGMHDLYSRPLANLKTAALKLQHLQAWLVGVHCPLETVLERRRATSVPGHSVEAVMLWQTEVHKPGDYDLELDTSILSPEACAQAISQLVNERLPAAFHRIASRRRPFGNHAR